MINIQLKFEAKTPNGYHIYNESHKCFKFQGQSDLEGKVKITSFQTHLKQSDA